MRIKPGDIIQMYACCWEDAGKTANMLGVHRSTVYRWVARARTLSCQRFKFKSLKRLSTRPHNISYALSLENQTKLINLHKQTAFTAEKLRKELHLGVSVSTVNRFLKSKGLVRKYGYHRRPYYQQTTHMHLGNTKTIGYLQMDVKYLTSQLTGLPWTCFEYAVIDIYSRYKDAVILNQLNEDGAILALTEILSRLPFKAVFLQTDNGLEFQDRFSKIVKAKGLQHHYVHKNTPNENAVIERSFRTDEDEFFFFRYKGAKDYDDLRNQFTSFLHFYNYERPHLGIDLKYPIEVIQLDHVAKVMKD
jgi:transposase InsO family protein